MRFCLSLVSAVACLIYQNCLLEYAPLTNAMTSWSRGWIKEVMLGGKKLTFTLGCAVLRSGKCTSALSRSSRMLNFMLLFLQYCSIFRINRFFSQSRESLADIQCTLSFVKLYPLQARGLAARCTTVGFQKHIPMAFIANKMVNLSLVAFAPLPLADLVVMNVWHGIVF